MGEGRLSSYSKQERIANQALRIQEVPKVFKAQMYEADKMFLMIEKDLRSCVALNVHPDQVNQEQFEDIKFKSMSPLDR